MENNLVFSFLEKEPTEQQYYIGMSVKEDKTVVTYNMFLKSGKTTTVILGKENHGSDLREEAENLAKYFGATILTQEY